MNEQDAAKKEPHAAVKINVYETPDAIFGALAQVWDVNTGGQHRWISFKTAKGVELTFFAGGDKAV